MSPLDWFKKERPLLGLLGLGGAGFAGETEAFSVSYSGSKTATTDGDYTVWTMWTGGTLTVTGSAPFDFMMVAKGGSNQSWYFGGGGGGGGVVYKTGATLSAGSYPVAIGNNTTYNGYTAFRGGGGGRPYGSRPSTIGGPPGMTPVPSFSNQANQGIPGGSGGGSGTPPGGPGGNATQPTTSQPTPVDQYGHAGSAQGGGGAAGGGGSGKNGGDGHPISITGSPLKYGGGSQVPAGRPPRGSGNGVADPSSRVNGRGGGGGNTAQTWPGDKAAVMGVPGSMIIRFETY